MATGLSESLALLDALDVGEVTQEFYFLRGPNNDDWRVHSRSGRGNWATTRAPRLSDAIAAHIETDEDDWSDLV